jgi:hypothetical protein
VRYNSQLGVISLSLRVECLRTMKTSGVYLCRLKLAAHVTANNCLTSEGSKLHSLETISFLSTLRLLIIYCKRGVSLFCIICALLQKEGSENYRVLKQPHCKREHPRQDHRDSERLIIFFNSNTSSRIWRLPKPRSACSS